MINGHDEVAVFLGLDVGKGGHHAVAQDRSGQEAAGPGAAQRRGQAPRAVRPA